MYHATCFSTINSDTTGHFFLDNCLNWGCGSEIVSHLQVRFPVMDELRNPKVTDCWIAESANNLLFFKDVKRFFKYELL